MTLKERPKVLCFRQGRAGKSGSKLEPRPILELPPSSDLSVVNLLVAAQLKINGFLRLSQVGTPIALRESVRRISWST